MSLEPLQEPLRNLVRVLVQRSDGDFVLPSVARSSFVDRGDGQVQLPTTRETSWREVATALMPDYRASEEFEAATRAVAARFDPPDDMAQAKAREAVDAFLSVYFEDAGGPILDETVLDKTIQELDDFLTGGEIEVRLVAPIQGLQDDSDDIEIAERLRLIRLTLGHRQRLWIRLGFDAAPLGLRLFPGELLQMSHCLQVDVRGKPLEFPDWGLGQQLLDKGLTVLALVSTEPVAPKCVLLMPGERFARFVVGTPSVGGVQWGPEAHQHGGPTGPLIEDAHTLLPTLFEQCETMPSDAVFDLAVRRLRGVFARTYPDDPIVDYWIALEALFLPETNELRYRAAIRISRFVGDDPEQRQAFFALLKASYNLRSAIVHGVPDGAGSRRNLNLTELTKKTHEVLQAALRKWLDPELDHSADAIDLSLFG